MTEISNQTAFVIIALTIVGGIVAISGTAFATVESVFQIDVKDAGEGSDDAEVSSDGGDEAE